MRETMSKLSTYISIFSEVKSQFDNAKVKLDEIKKNIAEEMFKESKNEVLVDNDVNGETWKCAYQTTTKSKVDYALLMEKVGKETYHDIVSNTSSEFLVIRKVKEKIVSEKEKTKTKSKNKKEIEFQIPMGTIV